MTDTTKTKRAPKAPTVVPLTDPPATTVPAEHLIPAWRNAFLAASDNKHRTTLYRTVLVEFYALGLRFVSTDGYVLSASWAAARRIPADAEEQRNHAPAHELPPIAAVVAVAADGLVVDFLKHRAVEVKEWKRAQLDGLEGTPVDVTLSVGTIDEPNTAQQRLDIGEQRALILSAENERIAVPLLDGLEFPNWRATLAGYQPRPRAVVSTTAGLLERLGKLRTGSLDVLSLTMANDGTPLGGEDVVLVAGAGPVPVEAAFAPYRVADDLAEDEAA